MLYFKVPVIDGVMDIDYSYLSNGIGLNGEQAVVELREGADVRESWEPITKDEFESHIPQEEDSQRKPSLEDKIDQLQQDNLLLMLALTDLYERLGDE